MPTSVPITSLYRPKPKCQSTLGDAQDLENFPPSVTVLGFLLACALFWGAMLWIEVPLP